MDDSITESETEIEANSTEIDGDSTEIEPEDDFYQMGHCEHPLGPPSPPAPPPVELPLEHRHRSRSRSRSMHRRHLHAFLANTRLSQVRSSLGHDGGAAATALRLAQPHIAPASIIVDKTPPANVVAAGSEAVFQYAFNVILASLRILVSFIHMVFYSKGVPMGILLHGFTHGHARLADSATAAYIPIHPTMGVPRLLLCICQTSQGQRPLQFYIGITSNPHWRCHNSEFGHMAVGGYEVMWLLLEAPSSAATRPLEKRLIEAFLNSNEVLCRNIDADATGSLAGPDTVSPAAASSAAAAAEQVFLTAVGFRQGTPMGWKGMYAAVAESASLACMPTDGSGGG